MSTQTLNLIPGLSSDSLKNLTGLSALISEHSASSTLWVMPPLVDLCARLRPELREQRLTDFSGISKDSLSPGGGPCVWEIG